MLFVSKKYESLDTIFEDEMNEAISIYSNNQEINDFIIKRNLPDIKDHLESAYSNDGFNNAVNPFFLIFNVDSGEKKGTLYFTNTIYGKEHAAKVKDIESITNTIKELFNGFDVQSGVRGNTPYFTVTDTKGKIIGGKRGSNGKGDTITFKFIGTGNTSTEGKFPSASEMEMVIAFSYNKNYGDFADDDQNAAFVGIPSGVRYKYYDYYNENEPVCRKMANYIYVQKHPAPLRKLPKAKSVTQAWKIAGAYTDADKIDTTPKTDLISSDEQCKFSLKQADKGAQAMSGGFRESRATVINVLVRLFTSKDWTVNGVNLTEEVNKALGEAAENAKQNASELIDKADKQTENISEEVIDRVKNLFGEIKKASDNDAFITETPGKTRRSKNNVSFAKDKWIGTEFDTNLNDNLDPDMLSKITSFQDVKEIIDYVNSIKKKGQKDIENETELTKRHIRQFIHRQMAQELISILQDNEAFRKAVMREAMTGEIKFGKDSPEAANYVLTWNLKGECKIEDIYKYAEEHSYIRIPNMSKKEEKELAGKLIDPTINFKGSSGKSYSAMRIGLNTSKLAINFEEFRKEAIENVEKEIDDAVRESNQELVDNLNVVKDDIIKTLDELNNK